ncbi:Putative conserved hypothetical protein [Candidatus Fokinia solitaria]|uniref:Endonuclease GajA/Old nuclease/RecF-like AAA domain-containing protein n=1 Tax=Candidatus Fokinia solitaria TaxID=1802984 RepID=A0A2U8BSZ4_9RICK|nr:AAA family ATPase [Candidatus Fokinia solitaria]AWD33484.1 Putative conserved hypothetical protein [Candidatus Fokinia solitaria]
MSTFLKELKITNYKCFAKEISIEFNVPNNKEKGSGLTVLIGNNGIGKTAILEAIEYLTLNYFSLQNKLDVNDFSDYSKSIVLRASTNEAKEYSIGISARDKGSRKAFTAPFIVQLMSDEKKHMTKEEQFNRTDETSQSELQKKVEIFFFKHDRAKEISSTGYRTAFQKITDELNWRFLRNIKQNGTNADERHDSTADNEETLKALVEELKETFSGHERPLKEFFEILEKRKENAFKDEKDEKGKKGEEDKKDERGRQYQAYCINLLMMIASAGDDSLQKCVATLIKNDGRQRKLAIKEDPADDDSLQKCVATLTGDEAEKKLKLLQYALKFMNISLSERYCEYADELKTLLSEGSTEKSHIQLRRAFDELQKYFPNNEEVKNINISPFNLLQPFSNASITSRAEKSLSQIDISSLGSGIQMMIALLILREIAEMSQNNTAKSTKETAQTEETEQTPGLIYLIDEPELHLHPSAQRKLMELLLEESKTKQIIIATHSTELIHPIFCKKEEPEKHHNDTPQTEGENKSERQNAPIKPYFRIFKRESQEITVTADAVKLLLPFPSREEIIFRAFDVFTTDFHNELYGTLYSKLEKQFYDEQKNKRFIAEEFDKKVAELKENLKEGEHIPSPAEKEWKKYNSKKGEVIAEKVTIHTYIRNSIHHPENTLNTLYTEKELKESIETLIKLLGDFLKRESKHRRLRY